MCRLRTISYGFYLNTSVLMQGGDTHQHSTPIKRTMPAYIIFQVDCTHQAEWMNEAIIRCDMLVLLDDYSITPISTELNPCAVPNTVLQWHARMKQIILTSCFILQEQEHISMRLPLTPHPTDFWLGDEDAPAHSALRLDYSEAVNLSEQAYVTKMLEQPSLCSDDLEAKEESRATNFVSTQGSFILEEEQHRQQFVATTNRSVLLTTSTSHTNHTNPHDQIQSSPQQGQQHTTLTLLELYLQQETLKNDRVIGFLVVLSMALLGIFGFVGYRLLPVRRLSKVEQLKQAWLAKQTLRLTRPNNEMRSFLKPIPTPKTRSQSPTRMITPQGPVCVSPPRPLPLPPRPKPSAANTRASFANELKAKADGANSQESQKTPTTWEDLM